MEFDNFKSLIDECGRFIRWLDFSGYGEPILHKNITEMVAYAKSKGIACIQCDTNANFELTTEKCKNIIDSGLDYLVVSVDGTTQEAYENYRRNGDLNLVLDFIRKIIKAREEKCAFTPIIIIQMIITKQTYPQIEDFKNLAQLLKADSFRIKNLWLNDYAFDPEVLKCYLPDDNNFRSYAVENGSIVNLNRLNDNFCRVLWDEAFVTWDGRLIPCCFDPNGETLASNVFESKSLRKAWNNRSFRLLRKNICKNKSALLMCKICPEH